MTDNHPFFRRIWRFNAVALAVLAVAGLLAGILSVGLVAYDTLLRTRTTAPAAQVNNSNSGSQSANAEIKTFGGAFTRIRNTEIAWSPVWQTERRRAGYISKKSTPTRNYLFHDLTTGTTNRLFKTNDQLILNHHVLPKPGRLAPSMILLEVVREDTSGDGYLTSSDDITLVAVRLDGQEHRNLATGIKTVTSDVHFSPTSTTLFVEVDEKLKALEIDPQQRRLVRTTELPPLKP